MFNRESTGTSQSRLDIEQTATFPDHYCTVWRVTWNITGTILASSGDDGCVRMWKMNYQKNWKCAAVLKQDGSESNPEAIVPSSVPVIGNSSTTKYYKRGIISHPNQVPWH